MAKKNETLPLLLSLVITLLLLGAGAWWLFNRLQGTQSGTSGLPTLGQTGDRAISLGGSLLVPEGVSANAAAQARKQAGAQAIAAKNFPQAVAEFEAALQAKANDPEALIYLNNARIGDQTRYTIAVAVPLDTDVDSSLEMLRGVAQAQNEVNQAGGINGVPLQVAIVNDGGTVAGATQTANQLVGNAQILGVVGHNSSDMSIAAGQIYGQNGLVMISPVSTSVKLSNLNSFVFRTVPSDFAAARALASYMTSRLQQQRALVVFNSKSGYSQSLKSEFTSALGLNGGQVVSEVDLSAPSFSAADSIRAAEQQGATTIALLPSSDQLDRALQILQVNPGTFSLLAGDDVYSPKTLSVGQESAESLVVAVPWHVLANAQSPFVQTANQLWKADVNWRTAMSYDATAALIAALRQSPSRSGVEQALKTPGFSAAGASGNVSFLPSGDRNQAVQLVQVQRRQPSRSGTGFDFIPIQP